MTQRVRSPTTDFDGFSEVYVSERLGPKRALTPEGFLLCQDVPIARTGWMYYAKGEVPVDADASGVARVHRGKEDLLSDKTLSSLVGKPVVDDHPEEDVVPENWKSYTVGVILRVWPVEPEDEPDVGLIMADILIMDPKAISAVQKDKREVSLGYDADYETTSPGLGRQTNILGNHLALVERGRCGPRCSIGDQETVQEKPTMARRNASGTRRVALAAHIRKAFKDAEAAALEEMTGLGGDDGSPADMDDGGDDDDDKHTHVHIHMNGSGAAPGQGEAPTHDEPPGNEGAPAPDVGGGGGGGDDPVEARFQKLEAGHAQILQQLQELAKLVQGGGTPAPAQDSADGMDGEFAPDPNPPQDDEQGARTNDSAALHTSWREVMSMAELLVPGVRVPTFDAAAPRKATVDSMCRFRRQVLRTLDTRTEGQQLLQAVGSGKPLDSLDCAATAQLFKAAAGAKRLTNNATSTRDAGTLPSPTPSSGKPLPARSVAELQAAFNALYAAPKAH